MHLSQEEITKIAHLARIAIDEQEFSNISQDLFKILSFVEQLKQVDTTHISPITHPLSIAQVLRDDKVTEPNQRAELQAIAPLTANGLYLVPLVIE